MEKIQLNICYKNIRYNTKSKIKINKFTIIFIENYLIRNSFRSIIYFEQFDILKMFFL